MCSPKPRRKEEDRGIYLPILVSVLMGKEKGEPGGNQGREIYTTLR